MCRPFLFNRVYPCGRVEEGFTKQPPLPQKQLPSVAGTQAQVGKTDQAKRDRKG